MEFDMDTSPSSARILIATDIVSDATMVKNLLDAEFKQVAVSTDPLRTVEDFRRYRPDVLLLAFNELGKSERYCLGLYHLIPGMHEHPPRTIVLCHKDEVKRAYELCMKDFFNDYILFWPMTYDASRLNMSLHYALRELSAAKSGGEQAGLATRPVRPEAFGSMPSDPAKRSDSEVEMNMPALERVKAEGRNIFKRLLRQAEQGFSGRSDVGVSPKETALTKPANISKPAATTSSQPLKRRMREFNRRRESILKSARTSPNLPEHTDPTVMVVDDDEFQRLLISRLLQEEHYHLVFASDGIEALNILRKLHPDIILMDVMMPDMDGVETTRRLKAAPRFAKTPVIMVTGKSEGQVVIDSLKSGAVDFVVKPFDRATLISKINHALGERFTATRH
jgi:CheY-like chemotaxis protein